MLKTGKGQKRIREKYRVQTVEDLDAEEMDKWRYPELFDVMDFSKCKAIGRATWILLHVVQAADRFETADAPAAVAIQGIKALNQYALDTNDWRLAWQMTGLKDPYGRLRFAGDEEELEDIAGFVEAEERLATKVLKTAPTGGGAGGARGRGGNKGNKNDKQTEDV